MRLGPDLLGVICGSEGQLGVVTEATLRILPKPEGRTPDFNRLLIKNRLRGLAWRILSRRGILPVAIEFMDKLCIEMVEDFLQRGLSKSRRRFDCRGRGQ